MTPDEAFKLIQHAHQVGRLSHSYLIVGPVRGIGMELTIRILQMLFCEAESKPCGTCQNCTLVAMRGHADIHWVAPEKKSRIISIEQVRTTLIDEIGKTALGGGWKAGVIIGADRLNESSANAFLKTLEEPPPQTLFLLLSETPQSLLATIVSRCQRIDLRNVQELEEPWRSRVLETLSTPRLKTPVERMAAAGDLSLILADIKGRAEKLVKAEDKQEAASELEEDDKGAFEARVSARYRELRTGFMLTLLYWFRDLLILKSSGDAALIYNQPYTQLLLQRSAGLTLAQTMHNVGVIEGLTRQLDRNVLEDNALSCAFDRLYHGAS